MKLSVSFVATALALSSVVHAAPLRVLSADLLERNSSDQASAAHLPVGSSAIEARSGWAPPAGGLFSIEDYLKRPDATFKAVDMTAAQDVADKFEDATKFRDQALAYPESHPLRDYYLDKYHANIDTLENHPRFQEGEEIFENTPVQRKRVSDDEDRKARQRAERQAVRDREVSSSSSPSEQARRREYEEQSAKFRAEFQRQQRNRDFKEALKRVWSRINGNGEP